MKIFFFDRSNVSFESISDVYKSDNSVPVFLARCVQNGIVKEIPASYLEGISVDTDKEIFRRKLGRNL